MKIFCLLFAIIVAIQAQEIAYYEEIKDLPNHPEVLLIDVREPEEIEATSLIPTSINVPCKFLNIWQAFM